MRFRRFFPDHQNKGYGKSILKRVCDFLILELKMKKLHVKCFNQNIKSIKIIENTGFKLIYKTEKMNYYIKQL